MKLQTQTSLEKTVNVNRLLDQLRLLKLSRFILSKKYVNRFKFKDNLRNIKIIYFTTRLMKQKNSSEYKKKLNILKCKL